MKFLLITNNDTDGVGQPAINLNNNLKKQLLFHTNKILKKVFIIEDFTL